MGHTDGQAPRGPRCIALVGPFQSGKTTLLEEILARTGAVARPGSVEAGTTVGDGSPEARHHAMSVEPTFATTSFLGDSYTFVDLPGSVEFAADLETVLPAVDAAVVVCEADPKKVPQLQQILRRLEDLGVPRFLFLNKIDKADAHVRETLEVLQPASRVPLVLRQIPIRSNGIITGFVDLALERAFVYREHATSAVVPLAGDDLVREKDARFGMLERLADHDDELLEHLLSEIEPPRDRVFDDLARELREGVIVPVLIGSAGRGHGVMRLLKALRHEAPGVAATAERLGLMPGAEARALVMKTIHTAHAGKVSVARVLGGEIGDGMGLASPAGDVGRVSAVLSLFGNDLHKRGVAQAGETVGLGKLDGAATGMTLGPAKAAIEPLYVAIDHAAPVLATAVAARDRKDDVKLGLAFGKLIEEDPSLSIEHNAEQGEVVLRGQGEMHLRVATERLAGRYGVAIRQRRPQVGYRETIRAGTSQRGRHKKQSGGHGQFGDVVIEVAPRARGEGFAFVDKITGGVVPRQYIPSVEVGVKTALEEGPLGFPVVDVEVRLTDGSYHTVDSSDMAFQMAGRIAIAEALPRCKPVLLEPVMAVTLTCPSDATATVNAIVSGRRGRILGFDTREGWPGWDVVRCLMPQAEIDDLIVEVRSATQGVGSFTTSFDHLAELSGRLADEIVATRKAAE